MDWHDGSGEIYLHAILTVLINSREPGVFILKPTWPASAKMGESRQDSQAAVGLFFAIVLEWTCSLKCL